MSTIDISIGFCSPLTPLVLSLSAGQSRIVTLERPRPGLLSLMTTGHMYGENIPICLYKVLSIQSKVAMFVRLPITLLMPSPGQLKRGLTSACVPTQNTRSPVPITGP